jgi:hypothetical protein
MANITYDIFGDVHGQYLRLTRILEKLGYEYRGGIYRKEEHKAIFLGDVVDRGINSARVLELVKNMVEEGCAEMIMGNHEYNLWGYLNTDLEGNFYRPHIPKNEIQVISTLRSYEGDDNLLEKHLNWIKNLPLYIDKKKFRAIHACWDEDRLSYFQKEYGRHFSEKALHESYTPKHTVKNVVKTLLSGPEINLPLGHVFYDADKIPRTKLRYKWWEMPNGNTYFSYAVKPDNNIPKIKVPKDEKFIDRSYSKGEKPLFIGHYSMRGKPRLIQKNLACLDWVNKRNRIVVYRFTGEEKLQKKNLVYFY